MRSLSWLLLLGCIAFAAVAQTPQSSSSGTTQSPPQLDHFDAKNANSALDPCTDFYQYACSRWIANNPVPPDEIFWGAFGKLQLWNLAFVHQTVLEVAAKPAAQRTLAEQKVGDYWSACTDEKQRDATSLDTLRRQLQQIDAMKSKSQIAEVLASLHRNISGVWNPAEPETYAALFGFGAQPDF